MFFDGLAANEGTVVAVERDETESGEFLEGLDRSRLSLNGERNLSYVAPSYGSHEDPGRGDALSFTTDPVHDTHGL